MSDEITITGHCYCGDIQYSVTGTPLLKGQCHCRECQYTSGGGANMFIAMPDANFAYTKGQPSTFQRSDLEQAAIREFCGKCGSPLLTRAPGMPGAVILKVGSMNDPTLYGMPQIAIFTCDQQKFHTIPDGVPSFDKIPG